MLLQNEHRMSARQPSWSLPWKPPTGAPRSPDTGIVRPHVLQWDDATGRQHPDDEPCQRYGNRQSTFPGPQHRQTECQNRNSCHGTRHIQLSRDRPTVRNLRLPGEKHATNVMTIETRRREDIVQPRLCRIIRVQTKGAQHPTTVQKNQCRHGQHRHQGPSLISWTLPWTTKHDQPTDHDSAHKTQAPCCQLTLPPRGQQQITSNGNSAGRLVVQMPRSLVRQRKRTSKSLRPLIHATECTPSGWTANSSEAKNETHPLPLHRRPRK